MSAQNGKLGTFAGVFTPSILTILGIILFLRLGYVVGSAGLGQALLMIAIANVISVLTSLSVAAIATNLKVKAGGDYYLISRTLGLSFGGALGLLLFLAQSVSIGFYALGFAEATAALLPPVSFPLTQPLAVLAVVALFALAWLGADWATRFQYGIMGLISLALVSFAVGGIGEWDDGLIARNWDAPGDGPPFWVLFAIFFPAVTGFTQGVSMSGDLRSPSQSLPAGTFAAVFVSIFVYLGAAVLLAGTIPGEVLRGEGSAMKQVALFTPLIDAGVIAATLSSALASFMGAPRILQAVAKDRIFLLLHPFAVGAGASGNPRRGVLLSGAIALGVIALGDLNAVASIVSMFFLISYGLLNYATFYEAHAASPSFRPTFRFYSKWLSLAGAVACLVTMLAIDVASGIVALALLFGVYQYITMRAVPARWADSRRSYHLAEVRSNLLSAGTGPEHPRDWRPFCLVFSADKARRDRLLTFSCWVDGGSGLTTVAHLVEGEGPAVLSKRAEIYDSLRKEIKAHGCAAFPLVVAVPDLDAGIATVVQAAGIGPIRVNTAIANWIDDTDAVELGIARSRFNANLRMAFRLGCNILVLDANADEWRVLEERPAAERVIDIWWRDDHTGRLMLVLAYLMTRSEAWEGARMRLIAEPDPGQSPEAQAAALKERLGEARFDAEPVIAAEHGTEALAAVSQHADVVFVPFKVPYGRIVLPFGGTAREILPRLPVTVLTLAAQDVDPWAAPEEGAVAEEAAEADRLERARRRLSRLEGQASEAAQAAWEARSTLVRAQKGRQPAEGDEVAALEADYVAREEEALWFERLARRAAQFLDVLEARAAEREGLSDAATEA